MAARFVLELLWSDCGHNRGKITIMCCFFAAMRTLILAIAALVFFTACESEGGNAVDSSAGTKLQAESAPSRSHDSVLIALQGSWAGAGNPDDVLLIEGNMLLSGSSEMTLSDTERIEILSEATIDGTRVKAKDGKLLLIRESNGLRSFDYLTSWGADEFSIMSGNNGQAVLYRRAE